jgi:hypothetical protein
LGRSKAVAGGQQLEAELEKKNALIGGGTLR